ncbi:MAG: PQQ-binding-like beta-propeller repeat protein [bacterium]
MKKIGIVFVSVSLLVIALSAGEKPEGHMKYWHQWRGPFGSGVSPDGDPPVEWNENKNVAWKIEIPGKGHATPIVWGDYLFVLTAIETDKEGKSPKQNTETQSSDRGWMRSSQTSKVHQFAVLCIHRHTGKILWQKTVKEEVPEESTHEFGSWASNSPMTDGEHIYAYFGSRGLFCLDMKGTLKWERDFGQMSKRMSFGEGSSPALYGNTIVVTWDHEGESFIYAIDKKTGKDIWKKERDEGTSWATPLVVEVKGKLQVIASATRRIRSYDLNTGNLIWECSGLTENVIPHPVTANGIVYLMSGFRGSALLAIDLSKATGDITDSEAVVWKYNKNTSYTPSPLLFDNKLYFLRVNDGALSCLDARDGRVYYDNERLEGMGNVFTSPVGTRDRIYIQGGSGTAYVLKHGSAFEILARNSLEDYFHASPVIVGNHLYLRGFKTLYCISEKK